MRSMGSLIVMGGIAAVAGATFHLGCIELDIDTDCNINLDCPSGPTGSTGTGGPDGAPPPSCIPSESTTAIADSCGVFVSSSKGNDTTGKGTKEAPYQTLAKALGAVGSQPVYACGETFTESVSISASVTIYGALACSQTWMYDPTQKTLLTAAADAIPMTLASTADGTVIHDFAITAADATAPGGSSIAVLDQAGVTLENVDIAAGAGAPGTMGAAQARVMTPTSANGTNGADDAACNMTSIIMGGAGGTNTCNGTATNGGDGGEGLPAAVADPGASGQPMTPANGGAGQTAVACQSGGVGTAGSIGSAGTGARGIGDVSTTGCQAAVATVGGAGQPGQGGGGGGAALACDAPTNMFAGPSGGGGGAGGCGGAPGNPGTSGGSSIGILALSAQLTLTTVTITTKAGGVGGLGSAGQLGGDGGLLGNAVAAGACPGGVGGQGGTGGPGGGGAGGHSVGIAIKNGTLPNLGSTTITPGSGGMGGAGGDTTMQTQGDDGMACKTLDFTTGSATPCGM
jgi:hypothetical protein